MRYTINDKEIQLALVLKLSELQRTHLKQLTYSELERVVLKNVWKSGGPSALHLAINDILSITAEKVVQCLSSQAIIDGYSRPLSDFQELLGGKYDK